MNRLQDIIHSRLQRIIQAHTNRNRAAIYCLRELGFGMPQIRQAIFALNVVVIPNLINGQKVSLATLYNAISGISNNEVAKSILAESVGLDEGELFPDNCL